MKTSSNISPQANISQQATISQQDRAVAFKSLHERPGLFVIPNPWDAGSASLLTVMGFEALTTTSAGLAFSLGKADGDGSLTRNETLENAKTIIAATTLPVAADLENGYGDEPASCAETIALAAAAGLVGGSIEDYTGRPEDPIYPFELAVERVRAAVAAARGLSFPFQLTARAENLIHGRMDLKDTIRRLEAFAEAGANVLYAPGLRTKEEIGAVVRAVAPGAVNVLMGLSGVDLTLDDLALLGVKRVSVGSLLARAAYGAFLRGAEEIQRTGSFDFAKDAVPFARLNELFSGK
jgi:2-methylisocitrate lyase-like PEP mutase family enzyme